MKKAALLMLLLLLVPLQAEALETDDLLGLVAMPIAVAAASDVSGVPVSDLSHFVATLNRAQVPPTQVVQVVRYAPAALVIQDQQPAFIQYVDTQVDQGVIGAPLVTVIENRYRTYDLEPQYFVYDEPATTYVVRDDYIPDVVVTRVSQVQPAYVVGDTNDLLALAAMPLAVAAVADITGIPFGDLGNLVASLNAARTPPVQVVEVLRYSPVVMVDPYERPRFVQFVNTQVVSGVTGPRLISVIDDRFRTTYDIEPRFDRVVVRDVVNVVEPEQFFPAVVTTRVAEVRAHPHGGPPGQLKKERGLQTGAEVVRGTPARTTRVVVDRDRPVRTTARRAATRTEQPRVVKERPKRVERVVKPRAVERPKKVRAAEQPRVERPRVERQRVEKQPRVERGGGNSHGNSAKGGGGGQGGGKAKGKGKGKG
ncbi:MAG TPA: hypothetical protein VF787_19620 [Thermoanaerobaculia bacterium]